MKNEINCLVCGSNKSEKLFCADDLMYNIKCDITYVRCKQCGLVYQKPRIDLGVLNNHYKEDYAPHNTQKLKNRVLKQDFFSKLKRSISEKLLSASSYKRIPGLVENKLTVSSRVFDFGCADGSYLSEVHGKYTCEVYGVDFSDYSIARGKKEFGLNNLYVAKTLNDLTLKDNFFDLITCWSVLPHHPDPEEVVKKFYDLLKDDGDCLIGVCNYNSFNARVFKTKWFNLDSPRHFQIFTSKTIRIIAERNGFKVNSISYVHTPWSLIHSLNLWKKNKIITSSVFVPYLFAIFTTFLSMIHLSDLMVVHLKKR